MSLDVDDIKAIAKAVVQEIMLVSTPPDPPPSDKRVNTTAWLRVMEALGKGNTKPYKEYLKRYEPPKGGRI